MQKLSNNNLNEQFYYLRKSIQGNLYNNNVDRINRLQGCEHIKLNKTTEYCNAQMSQLDNSLCSPALQY